MLQLFVSYIKCNLEIAFLHPMDSMFLTLQCYDNEFNILNNSNQLNLTNSNNEIS